jgi:FMN reductase
VTALLGISGSVGSGRRTTALVRAVLESAVAADPALVADVVELQQVALPVCDGRPPDAYGPAADEVIRQIRAADGLVIGTPVYRASFSAVLKNLLDLVPADVMAGKPATVVVTGGSRDHYLVGDYALRPVLAALRVHVLPTALYADPPSMPDGVVGTELAELVRAAALELAGTR